MTIFATPITLINAEGEKKIKEQNTCPRFGCPPNGLKRIIECGTSMKMCKGCKLVFWEAETP